MTSIILNFVYNKPNSVKNQFISEDSDGIINMHSELSLNMQMLLTINLLKSFKVHLKK